MRSWITDYDFYKSAQNLNRQHLQANIYENIHGLASILDCVNELQLSEKAKIQVKKYKNKPQCQIWVGYENELFIYIRVHLHEWINIRNFKSEINLKNYRILENIGKFNYYIKTPIWITDELIQSHRKLLIQKEIEKENNYDFDSYADRFCEKNKCNACDGTDYNGDPNGYGCGQRNDFVKLKYKTFFHYRSLWPELAKEINK